MGATSPDPPASAGGQNGISSDQNARAFPEIRAASALKAFASRGRLPVQQKLIPAACPKAASILALEQLHEHTDEIHAHQTQLPAHSLGTGGPALEGSCPWPWPSGGPRGLGMDARALPSRARP